MYEETGIGYDSSSLDSICRYAKRLEGHTLREECPELTALEDSHRRKGSFGNAVEQYYFHYAINSDPNPDFEEVGTELKTTPLKLKRDGSFSAKERLVISMINYMSVVDETWETSSLQKKLQKILLVAYQYEKDINPVDFLVKVVELWGVPQEDIPTFKSDWDTVVAKIRAGKAHELSGSDTLYLEAATKASSSKDRRQQPFSDVPAKPRAWAIKNSYMTVALNGLLEVQKIKRERDEEQLDLYELIHRRFESYFGLTEVELAEVCGYVGKGPGKPKNLCALITRHILGVDEDARIAEFEKAGIKPKTMRVKANGVPKESISFPVFDYFDLVQQSFEESEFWDYLHQKYLFVIYREDADEKGIYRLSEVLFWQMPDADLIEARHCYDEMQRRVKNGHAEQSVRSTENRCCHVRPHGRNKMDALPTPYGTRETKKCFWINARYIGEEIDRVEREKSRWRRDADVQNNGDGVSDQVIRVAELFAGVGGFRLGLEGYVDKTDAEMNMPAAGPFKTVWANQWEPPGTPARQFAADCYRKRFDDGTLLNEDIHAALDEYERGTIDIPDVDMVVGGFPCQDYSVAKPLSKASGIEGKKGVLWWDIYRFLKLKKCPRYVLLENVDRLLKSPASQRGRDFAIILSCLASLGYAAEWRVINGADYGFPQKRRRTYIYAEKTDEIWDLKKRLEDGVMAEAFPAETLGDMAESAVFDDPYDNTQKFGIGLKTSPFQNAGVMQGCTFVTAKVQAKYAGVCKALGDVLVNDEDVPEEFFVENEKLDKWRYLKGGKSEPRVDKRTGFTYNYSEGSMAFPDSAALPARTILTSEGGGGASRTKHIVQAADGRFRRLLPDELDQLQGFPKGWTDTGMTDIQRAFCAGNALIVGIPHRIGQVIAGRVLEA